MATTALAGTFNAFAFAGAGYLFKLIDKGGYEKEIKRHNKAMEELTKQRDLWNQERDNELDRLAQLHYDKYQSQDDIKSTNKDFLLVQSKFDKTKPKLEDFYKPSHTMQEYMSFMKLVATVPVIYAVMALV